jgi:phage I-like protein
MKTKRIITSAVALAACRVDLNRTAPTEVRLIPAGFFKARDGRPAGLPNGWHLDAAGAERLIAQARNRIDSGVIDYEHQTLNAETNGKPAPAAGFFSNAQLEWRTDGLYATGVEWTAAARAAIEAGEYRYLSPVLTYHPKTGDVLSVEMAALTNYPAIDGLDGLAVRAAARFTFDNQPEDSIVNRDELIKQLGLAADASDEVIAVAVKAATAAQAQLAALRTELELKDGDEPRAAIAALKTKAAAAKPDMAQFVPKAVHDETRAQLAALKANSDTAQIEALIKEGMDDGRIAGKATAEWLRSQGLAALKAHLADAPSLAALKGTQTQGKPPKADTENGELSEAEMAVCKNMGIDPKTWKESNQ